MSEILNDLRRHLRPDRPDDIAAFEAGIAVRSTGRGLIRVRDDRASSAAATALIRPPQPADLAIRDLRGRLRFRKTER
jgi:hypothetical protein